MSKDDGDEISLFVDESTWKLTEEDEMDEEALLSLLTVRKGSKPISATSAPLSEHTDSSTALSPSAKRSHENVAEDLQRDLASKRQRGYNNTTTSTNERNDNNRRNDYNTNRRNDNNDNRRNDYNTNRRNDNNDNNRRN